MQIKPNRVVCVCLGKSKREMEWYIGIILADVSTRQERLYRVEVHCRETEESFVPRVVRGQDDFLWDDEKRCDAWDSRVVLFARIASRSFLRWFAEKRVLPKREIHVVPLAQICEARPTVLWQRMFQGSGR